MDNKDVFRITSSALEAVMLKFDGKLSDIDRGYCVEGVDGVLAVCDPYGTVIAERGDVLEITRRRANCIDVQVADTAFGFSISNAVAKEMGIDVSNRVLGDPTVVMRDENGEDVTLGETARIDVKALYEKFGERLNSGVRACYIKETEDGYAICQSDGTVVCRDGEMVEVIERTADGVAFRNINLEGNLGFVLATAEAEAIGISVAGCECLRLKDEALLDRNQRDKIGYQDFHNRRKVLDLLASRDDVAGMRELEATNYKNCNAILVDAIIKQATDQGFEINREIVRQYVEGSYAGWSVGVEVNPRFLYEKFGNELTYGRVERKERLYREACVLTDYTLYNNTGRIVCENDEGDINILEADENGITLINEEHDDIEVFRLSLEEAVVLNIELGEYRDCVKAEKPNKAKQDVER